MAIKPNPTVEDLIQPQDLQLRLHRHEDDRRQSAPVAGPWLTEEGIVMVDRRSGDERRHAWTLAQDLGDPVPPSEEHH
ncbi:hypothetical protein [Amantichitinum ursilacus]|uniref:Uncharacterized protein n=1 Tax=Amantichitinum ursilacus TaxID=857265 RepID=A0A0N0XHL2_9NEIS|nr:hypothetical protein [Amantichitinum ursilacus]KPC51738.1 hypothetical protein WG78_15305 [Amantichitinum ursilacus]